MATDSPGSECATDAVRCLYLARVAERLGHPTAAARWYEKAGQWLESAGHGHGTAGAPNGRRNTPPGLF